MANKSGKKRKGAVALKYEPELYSAPHIVAKGKGIVAKRIIQLAKKYHIPIHEDPDLVETLSGLDLNQEIPPELYTVIAELLAFVYRLNRKKMIK